MKNVLPVSKVKMLEVQTSSHGTRSVSFMHRLPIPIKSEALFSLIFRSYLTEFNAVLVSYTIPIFETRL